MEEPFLRHWNDKLVVVLTATEKVTLPYNGTVWFVGWTVMTGGGDQAKQGVARSKPEKNQQIAVFSKPRFSRRVCCQIPTPVFSYYCATA